MGGMERVLQGIGASPPCSRHSSARPPLSGAGGAGTWAGAIPRPKNNGRELGRGRGEAAPQRLPDWGSGATPRGEMRGQGWGTRDYGSLESLSAKLGRPARKRDGKADPLPSRCSRGGAEDVERPD